MSKFTATLAALAFFIPAIASAGAMMPSAADCTAMGLNVIDHSAASSGQFIRGTRGADCIIGSAFDDVIRGRGGNDIILGGDGDDMIRAGRGDDIVWGGMGDDNIRGGSGADTLNGGGGNDDLRGNRGDDHIDGGAGDDTLRGGSGDDALTGNDGNDRYRGGRGSDGCDGDNFAFSGRAAPRGCRSRRNDLHHPMLNAMISSTNDRANAMLLNGVTITGDVYAFISDPHGNLTKVEFILNGRKVFQEMGQEHYDLCGSNAGDSIAYRFPSRYAAAGSNTLVFRVHYSDGDTHDFGTSFFRR